MFLSPKKVYWILEKFYKNSELENPDSLKLFVQVFVKTEKKNGGCLNNTIFPVGNIVIKDNICVCPVIPGKVEGLYYGTVKNAMNSLKSIIKTNPGLPFIIPIYNFDKEPSINFNDSFSSCCCYKIELLTIGEEKVVLLKHSANFSISEAKKYQYPNIKEENHV